jgi:hypothetical protein
MDRSEWAGTGAALLFHAALIGALTLSLAQVASVPESPSMEVEFVEDVGLTAAAPQSVAVPPPPSQAPEIGQAEPTEPVQTIQPARTPSITPTPAKPQPPAKPAPRVSRIGDDFLKGIRQDAPARSAAPAQASAATVSPSAMAGIVQAIRRQVQPCADRQVNPGEGASRIRVRLRLRLLRNGRLRGPPQVVGTSGVDDENARYEERVKDLAVATFVGCAPLTGLPPELYETESGKGWSDLIMIYNLP